MNMSLNCKDLHLRKSECKREGDIIVIFPAVRCQPLKKMSRNPEKADERGWREVGVRWGVVGGCGGVVGFGREGVGAHEMTHY